MRIVLMTLHFTFNIIANCSVHAPAVLIPADAPPLLRLAIALKGVDKKKFVVSLCNCIRRIYES